MYIPPLKTDIKAMKEERKNAFIINLGYTNESMNHSSIQFDELPDEILLIIFKKLDHIRVLYSFIGVNKRLQKIASDYFFPPNV